MRSIVLVILAVCHAFGAQLERLNDDYDPSLSCPSNYPSTVTSTVPLTIKESVTKTETIVTILKPSTITSTLIVPTTSTEVRTATSCIADKSTTIKFITTTVPVTTTLTTTLCTLNNEYLPAKNDPTCVPPPNTYLPADILPPFAPSTLEVLNPSTECRSPSTITITITVLALPPRSETINIRPSATSTKYVMPDVVTVTKSLTRTRSIILYDQLVTKLVSVTPTLTSYIYLEPVTKTMPARKSPTNSAG
ncbi:AAEL008877-PA [Aedes aegypti]|uniref:AAEL008877-PA n=1 Tax=Aedes aegypti TaxID=7159 RepID=Q16XG4_AEDAE|nr:AAEL008877-PA [Aedes aegypti]